MATLSLLRQGSELADPAQQLQVLDQLEGCPTFLQRTADAGVKELRADGIEILQVNVGKLCNQTCTHCHVDAGPDRRESMSRETAQACIDALERSSISTLDITGGAPEMNPQFRFLVENARRLDRKVIDRCNLTILEANGYEDLAEFLADHRVDIVASLPCYLEENTDKQRGKGVYTRSINALRRLNALGYGMQGSGLSLSLVYNPIGPHLPPDQAQLEADYKRELRERYEIEFNQLLTITNLPISRFLQDLLDQGKLDQYMETLVQAFNPGTLAGLMCRNTLSVDWNGYLFDCDFNQMLGLSLHESLPKHISEFSVELLTGRTISTNRHCFGCSAGSGSSCGGAIV